MIEKLNMLNGLLMSPLSWRITSSRIFGVVQFSQYGTSIPRNFMFSDKYLMSSRNSLGIVSSSNKNNSSLKQCDYTTSISNSPFLFESLKTRSLQSSVFIPVRSIHEESKEPSNRRFKPSNRDNKHTTKASDNDVAKDYVSSEESPDSKKKLTIVQRFKKTYKEHGKVLIVVHLITSAVWYGSFYGAARWGVDIVPFLESWNFGESYIKPFRAGGAGDFALAYLFYKLATPARYTVTIVGTNLTIKFLKRGGQMKPVSSEDTLTSLYKESKTSIKRRSALEMRKGVTNMRSNIKRVRSKMSNKHRTKSKDKHN